MENPSGQVLVKTRTKSGHWLNFGNFFIIFLYIFVCVCKRSTKPQFSINFNEFLHMNGDAFWSNLVKTRTKSGHWLNFGYFVAG